MAFATRPIPPGSVLLVLSDDDRVRLIFALDIAVDLAPGTRGTIPTWVDGWKDLRKALAAGDEVT